jgi:hypothetical protein
LRDDLKKRLLRVAEEYERLAQRAEHRSQEQARDISQRPEPGA